VFDTVQYTRPLSVQIWYSRLCPTNSSSCYHGRQTVVHITAVIFSELGFTLSIIENIFIFMIWDNFCLLPAKFYYVIINMQNSESHMHITNRCVPRKIANGAENFIFAGVTRVTTTITATVNYIQEPHKANDLLRPVDFSHNDCMK
jgi:hypothetical protein